MRWDVPRDRAEFPRARATRHHLAPVGSAILVAVVQPTLPEPFEGRWRRRPSWLLATVAIVGFGIAVAGTVLAVRFDALRAGDASNAPAVEEGTAVAVDTGGSYDLDVLVAFERDGLDGPIIGRIVGLGGQQLEWTEAGRVIDGVPAPEPHLDGRTAGPTRAPFLVPIDTVFVLTDDRTHDANRWMGTVPLERLIGTVAWRIWPPASI